VAVVSILLASVATTRATNPAIEGAPAVDTGTGLEGWIEGVVGDPVVGGKVAVAGWAADRGKGSPVYRIEVFLDGRSAGFATVGVERADVAKVLSRPDYAKAGWTAVIDLQGVSPGAHRISAIAQDAKGTRQSLHGDKRITVRASGAPPAAPASP
jgi:hypothetical protein